MKKLLKNKIIYIALIIIVVLIQPEKYPSYFFEYNIYEFLKLILLLFVLPTMIIMLSKQTTEVIVLIFVLFIALFSGMNSCLNSAIYLAVFSISVEILKIVIYCFKNIKEFKNLKFSYIFSNELNLLSMKHELVFRMIIAVIGALQFMSKY